MSSPDIEAIVSLLKHEMAYAEANGFQRSTIWMSRETTDTICAALARAERLEAENAKLVSDLKTAVWTDSEHCTLLEAENAKLRARVETLESALRWYVENDDVNLHDLGNQFWIDGYNRAKALLSDASRAALTAREKE